MTPRTYGRARDLFARARRLPRDGRTAWLRQHCDQRATLLAEVRALLAQDEDGAGSFLGMPAVRAGAGAGAGAPGGDAPSINGYGVMRSLHAGATGALHLARQRHPIRRNVVIKTVKHDADDARARARLSGEVRALAATDHPNVVTLLDAGAARDGRPFLAMRHVNGVGITRFCAAHRAPLPRRIELFLHACEAVRHVHERGVVHRALGPDHLLVALHGRTTHLTLVGFGAARLMCESYPDDWPGGCDASPYAPPERAARGGADPRGDVYSLGVILRELIPPDARRSARAGLNAIVCRATQDDPSRRYQTVDQLADAVHACAVARRSRVKSCVIVSVLSAMLVASVALVARLL